jgi:hypothetical protein
MDKEQNPMFFSKRRSENLFLPIPIKLNDHGIDKNE